MIGQILGLGGKILDKVIPDANAKREAKIKLAELEQEGELKELEIQMSAIIAEAKSSDPWTSRARPSFMYVIYIMLLSSIPFAVFSAFDPSKATLLAQGLNQWFEAIPGELYALFGAGYLGYATSRSFDKNQILKSKEGGILKKLIK